MEQYHFGFPKAIRFIRHDNQKKNRNSCFRTRSINFMRRAMLILKVNQRHHKPIPRCMFCSYFPLWCSDLQTGLFHRSKISESSDSRLPTSQSLRAPQILSYEPKRLLQRLGLLYARVYGNWICFKSSTPCRTLNYRFKDLYVWSRSLKWRKNFIDNNW